MISTRMVELVIDTVVCLTLAKWETVSGPFGGYLRRPAVASPSVGISFLALSGECLTNCTLEARQPYGHSRVFTLRRSASSSPYPSGEGRVSDAGAQWG